MGRNQFALLTIGLSLFVSSLGYGENGNISISCDEANHLKSISLTAAADQSPLPHAKSGPTFISISLPYDTPYRNRTANDYDRDQLRSVVRTALKSGVDPFLAVAISVIEFPLTEKNLNSVVTQIQGSSKPFLGYDYVKRYGVLPLDAIAIYDGMGCGLVRFPPNVTADVYDGSRSLAVVAAAAKNGSKLLRELDTSLGEVRKACLRGFGAPGCSDAERRQIRAEVAIRDLESSESVGKLAY